MQNTSFLPEYIAVGKASATVVKAALKSMEQVGIRVLDFGCGSGRTLRYLRSTDWELHGCDVDESAIRWCKENMRFVTCTVNLHEPPLAYPSEFFDAIYAISVFTHFADIQQQVWAAELARLLKPGALMLITTMGEALLGGIAELRTDEREFLLQRDGFVFDAQPGGFNRSGAFHAPSGIERIFRRWFTIETFIPFGLGKYQDVYVLRRM